MANEKLPFYRNLHIQIGFGIAFAFVVGLVLRGQLFETLPLSADALAQLESYRAPFQFVGDMFIRLLKFVVVPLIVFSVMGGILKLETPARLRTIGVRTMVYYMGTTLVAVVIGIIFVNIVDPGVGLDLLPPEGTKSVKPTPLLDVIRNIVPTNFFGAIAAGKMLPIIFGSVLFGLAILIAGEVAKPLRPMIDGMNEAIFKIVDWVMVTAPIGVFGLIVSTLLNPQLADVGALLKSLLAYSLTVVGGLGIHGFVALPIILFVFAKRNPIEYLWQLAPALLTAFSTASSAATYPVTRERTVEHANVDSRSADFVLPLGATINMDGTALYEAVAAVFIANAMGIELTFTAQIIIVITATLAAIGAAGVPSAGLVTMIIVLEAVGLPAEGYGIVVAVDRILDMCRTTINVWGDSVGAAVVERALDDA